MKMPTEPDYRSLAEVRYQIRKFLHFSEQATRQVRMEPQQHQFLLALKGLPEKVRPNVGALAERLQIQPNSAVELTNRLVKKGLVRRHREGGNGRKDGREVLLTLTIKGEDVLRELSLYHREELRTAGPALIAALQAVLKRAKPRRSPKA
jgi:DNA-binding MarR family transcriptional regulator